MNIDILNKLILGELKLSQALYYVITNYSDYTEPDFIEWAEQECNGYKDSCSLPNYRFIDCEVFAKYTDNFGNEHDELIDVKTIDNYLMENNCENALISKMRISQGIESLENSIMDNNGGSLVMPFPSGMSEMISRWYVCPAGCHSFSVYQKCHIEQGANIITVVKTRLINTLKNIKPMDVDNAKEICTGKPLIFISHASKDKQILKFFVDNILKKGIGLKDENIAFTSYEATGVVPGDNIPDYIKRNIASANIVLAMVSKNYKTSEVCMNEVGAAWALGKTPIQIMLPNTNIDKLGWLIHLDKAARINSRDSLDSLEEVICNGLGLKIPTPKHWNPCTQDFLDALKALPDLYNEDEPEISVMDVNGEITITCIPKYKKIYYCERMKEDKTPQNQKNNVTELAIKGSTSSIIASLQNSIEYITPVTSHIVHREINNSKVKIRLMIKNNSDTALENGKIIIQASDKSVVFSKENVIEHNSFIARSNLVTNQLILTNEVNEDFPKPINPTAVEYLYDFYISAPHNIDNFQLKWKLESLKEPKYGEIIIKWNPEYIDEVEAVNKGDERIGTIEIRDYIEEE